MLLIDQTKLPSPLPKLLIRRGRLTGNSVVSQRTVSISETPPDSNHPVSNSEWIWVIFFNKNAHLNGSTFSTRIQVILKQYYCTVFHKCNDREIMMFYHSYQIGLQCRPGQQWPEILTVFLVAMKSHATSNTKKERMKLPRTTSLDELCSKVKQFKKGSNPVAGRIVQQLQLFYKHYRQNLISGSSGTLLLVYYIGFP